jgi:hypothetical protein
MKWYKHLSASLNSSFIYSLIEKFGGDGYLVFFGTLELMSDEFDIFNPGVSELSYKKLTKNLQLSRRKTVRILTEIHQNFEKDPLKKTGFSVEFKKHTVVINSHRLRELCDNHTTKLLKDALKLLRSENEVTLSQRSRSKKKEVRKDFKSPPASAAPKKFKPLKKTPKLESICTELVTKNIFTKAHMWKNKMINSGKNEGAIFHTLNRCLITKTFKTTPWAFCDKVISIENGNYNEAESIKKHEEFKNQKTPKQFQALSRGLLKPIEEIKMCNKCKGRHSSNMSCEEYKAAVVGNN